MGTPYTVPIELFFKKVEKDVRFFNYFGLDDYRAMRLAEERAKTYLSEAVGRLMLECSPSVDFTDVDGEAETFNFDLTTSEKLLLSSLMYEYYLERDIAYLRLQNVNYVSTELRVFDPSNARNSFMEMYESVCNRNKELLEEYRNRDRLTGAFIGVDYTVLNADS